MKKIEYIPTKHILMLPDDTADHILNTFPDNYKLLDNFVRCEFANICQADCSGDIEYTETCDSYQLHQEIKALKAHSQELIDRHDEYKNAQCYKDNLINEISKLCEAYSKHNEVAQRILQMIMLAEETNLGCNRTVKEL